MHNSISRVLLVSLGTDMWVIHIQAGKRLRQINFKEEFMLPRSNLLPLSVI